MSTRTVHACSECGAEHPQWSGRCGACQAWNTLVSGVSVASLPASPVVPARISDVDASAARPQPTGIGELDRVLGGGLVPGSLTLLGGEPGIGKSTLALQTLAWWPGPALYVCAEESAQQVRLRAARLGATRPDLWVVDASSLADVVAAIAVVQPQLVIVDSIQTVADTELANAPGSVTQVRGCAQRLSVEAKRLGIATVLVGHVTKDGSLAGPRTLEHLVDTVLSFEGDLHHALRLLRAVKHRFGPTSELGLFEMTGTGLVGVPDPSAMFLADRRPGCPGSSVAVSVEGRRPLVVEVQALTVPVPAGASPRRSIDGLDPRRVALLLAVLERRADVRVSDQEVYASTVGGVRLAEPGADLAVCLAIASAAVDRPLPDDLVAIGEVGLGGEVRQVTNAARRLAEASRLGFRHAIVPATGPVGADGIALTPALTLVDALVMAGVLGGAPSLSRARR